MTVFKTFLKVLNKNKVPVIMYTVILLAFGSLNFQTNDPTTTFTANKPDILIINKDSVEGITKNLINYMQDNCNVKKIDENKSIDDALFYRDINYIMYIPQNYREDFLKGNNPTIEVKSTGDYQAELAEMILTRYLKVASVYRNNTDEEEEIITNIKNTLYIKSEIDMVSKLDTNKLSRVTFYYNFANYSILAGSIFVVCLILASFKEENVRKRTIVSSIDTKKYNRILLISNFLFVFLLWLLYCIASIILLGDIMLTTHGLLYMLNSFIFSLVSLTIAFLIGNIITNKNAVGGVVNVVALGSSFLCGAFVPLNWIPDYVLKIARLLPSYWYIKSNELLKLTETINLESLKPIGFNTIILLFFMLIFITLTNVVSITKLKNHN